MEEKTNQMTAQEVMPEVEAPKEQSRKVSYEQLENIAHQLSEQNSQLVRKLQEINMQNVFARLNFLFRVVEFGSKFPEEFLTKCINEIVSLMTVESTDTEKEETE